MFSKKENWKKRVICKFCIILSQNTSLQKSIADVIISVGYRVKSQRGTQFRIWANKVLKEYLVKGYAVNKALTEQRYTELKQNRNNI